MAEQCIDCGSEDSLANCTVCEELVCPRHRAGTGALADGYQCLNRGCFGIAAVKYMQKTRLFEAADDGESWSYPSDPIGRDLNYIAARRQSLESRPSNNVFFWVVCVGAALLAAFDAYMVWSSP